MINEKMYGLGDEPSAIRELFAYGMARKAEIGAENVFDFSIGNPSVPAPDLVRETMLELLDMDPVTLHAYSPAAGLPEVKEAIAAYLSNRYDTLGLFRVLALWGFRNKLSILCKASGEYL